MFKAENPDMTVGQAMAEHRRIAELTNNIEPDRWAALAVELNGAYHEIESAALTDTIQAVLATLSEREAGVIRLRFGLNGTDPYTYDEVSQIYGVTRERIRQIERKTMGKLREPNRAHALRDWL